MIALSAEVNELLEAARQAALSSDLERAESLYRQAMDVAPGKRAPHGLGRFYYDNGQQTRGLAVLREHGMLIDVPRLPRAPHMDGKLDEALWQQAAETERFFSFSRDHDAALPSHQVTRVRLGYTDDSLYVGYFCEDQHPDSLVVGSDVGEWGEVWFDDDVELYFDANFDRRTYCQIGMNSVGTVNSNCFDGGLRNRIDWTADGEVATHVGDDYWSVEYRLKLGADWSPCIEPGDIWGFNLVRVFRGSEYAQWTRTYGGNAHQPDQFGLLLFR